MLCSGEMRTFERISFVALILAFSSCNALKVRERTSTNATSRQCGRPTFAPIIDPPSGIVTVPPSGIVGGEPSNASSWPWQISLQYRGVHSCGGSLIDTRHVLTAAHCTDGISPTSLKVLAGIYDQRQPESSYQKVAVERIIQHPSYETFRTHIVNDVSILRLASPVQFNANVSAVCLPQDAIKVGRKCFVTGWGHTHGTGDDNILLQVAVPVIASSTCNDTDHHKGLIDNGMICAAALGKDACKGDSGGPFVCQRSDSIWELQGITSWGDGCAVENKPGVYARVTHFKNWIKQNVK